MVRITNAVLKDSENGPFVLLELSGELEMVQSQNSGRFYATVRKCNISATVDLETAKGFIGKEMEGNIVRVETEPYEHLLERTGELVTLSHRWEFRPPEASLTPLRIVHKDVAA